MPDLPAKLALEDGTVYTGRGFGATGETFGEAVFNTSMTGYQIGRASCRERGEVTVVDVGFSSRRRHTRWPRDWSSDVCSSDLQHILTKRDFVSFCGAGIWKKDA